MGNTRLISALYESRQSGIFKGVIFHEKKSENCSVRIYGSSVRI